MINSDRFLIDRFIKHSKLLPAFWFEFIDYLVFDATKNNSTNQLYLLNIQPINLAYICPKPLRKTRNQNYFQQKTWLYKSALG